MEPLLVKFYASSRTGLRAQAMSAVTDARRRGSNVLVVGLDNIARLDDAAVAAVIVALRELRKMGGTVRLVTQSIAHRRYLNALKLDRVFEIFATDEDAVARNRSAIAYIGE
jgi:anti-anti-sigma regulatory factor